MLEAGPWMPPPAGVTEVSLQREGILRGAWEGWILHRPTLTPTLWAMAVFEMPATPAFQETGKTRTHISPGAGGCCFRELLFGLVCASAAGS